MSVEVRAKTRSKPNTVHYAAETGDIKLLEHFVREGMAIGNPESVTLQSREDVLGMMPLHVACENGELEVVEFLVKKRVDVDAGDNFKVTALHLASIENHADIVEVLLKARADPKPADVEGDLPIHWAATKGHSQVIEVLARKGSPIDVPNKKGWTPLHRAAYNGRKDATLTLIKLGAKVNGTTSDGSTPLHLACFMNQLSTIEKLCEAGASQHLLNKNNQRPIDLCITDAARDILKNLQGFQGDSPAEAPAAHGTKSKETSVASASPGKPVVPPNLASLQISSSKKIAHDGFPSPVGSFSAPRPAGGEAGGDFIQTALGETGTNPYTGMSAGASTSGSRISGRTALPGNAASGSRTDIGRPGSQGAGPGPSGLAAHPTPLAGALRPLRAPSPGGSNLVVGSVAVGPLRPRSSGILGSTGDGEEAAVQWTAGMSGHHPGAQPEPQPPSSNPAPHPGSQLSSQLLAEDMQDRIKEENRRLAASNDVLRPRTARPVSANKKFLARYNLDKLNLFAP